MKGANSVKNNSSNGDLHFLWEESTALYASKDQHHLTMTEAKKVSKVEASKPLLIARTE